MHLSDAPTVLSNYLGLGSVRVDGAGDVLKTETNSQPIGPAPITAKDHGEFM
jgi:hypothetical protein